MFARLPTAKELEGSGFTPADYETDPVEVWPENWPAFSLFCRLQTQWRASMNGPTGLDYTALLALMSRMKLSDEDHEDLFADVQTLERAALEAMNQKE